MISRLSCLGMLESGLIKEVDLNPVIAGPHGVTAVDWLIVTWVETSFLSARLFTRLNTFTVLLIFFLIDKR